MAGARRPGLHGRTAAGRWACSGPRPGGSRPDLLESRNRRPRDRRRLPVGQREAQAARGAGGRRGLRVERPGARAGDPGRPSTRLHRAQARRGVDPGRDGRGLHSRGPQTARRRRAVPGQGRHLVGPGQQVRSPGERDLLAGVRHGPYERDRTGAVRAQRADADGPRPASRPRHLRRQQAGDGGGARETGHAEGAVRGLGLRGPGAPREAVQDLQRPVQLLAPARVRRLASEAAGVLPLLRTACPPAQRHLAHRAVRQHRAVPRGGCGQDRRHGGSKHGTAAAGTGGQAGPHRAEPHAGAVHGRVRAPVPLRRGPDGHQGRSGRRPPARVRLAHRHRRLGRHRDDALDLRAARDVRGLHHTAHQGHHPRPGDGRPHVEIRRSVQPDREAAGADEEGLEGTPRPPGEREEEGRFPELGVARHRLGALRRSPPGQEPLAPHQDGADRRTAACQLTAGVRPVPEDAPHDEPLPGPASGRGPVHRDAGGQQHGRDPHLPALPAAQHAGGTRAGAVRRLGRHIWRDCHGARDRTRRQRLPAEHAVRALHQRAGPDGRVLRTGRHPHTRDAEPAGAGPEGPEAPDGDLPAEQRAQGVRAIAGAPRGAAQDRPHRSAGGQHAEHHQ